MPISTIEFTGLEKDLAETNKSLLDYLAPEMEKVYVISVTRDNCPACEKQKPRIKRLASKIVENYGEKVIFKQIHVRQPAGTQDESLRSKSIIGHYFYPTNLILLKTEDKGAIELYRNVSPDMNELRKNINTAIKIAEML